MQASISLAFFDAYYRQLDIGKNGSIALAMRDGTVIDRRPFREDIIGKSMQSPLFRDHIAYDEAGSLWITSPIDGVERLIAFQKLNRFPVYSIVALAKDDILSAWAADALVHASAALFLVALLAILGARLIGQLAKTRDHQLALLASQSELEAANVLLSRLAREDGLTGLANRREFDRCMSEEVRRAARTGEPLALLLLDIDWFKHYNDRFGHPAGDACLRRIAATIQAHLRRPGDLGARYGSEEFALLLPATDAAGAGVVADELRRAIRDCAMPHPASAYGLVTVSVGVAVSEARTSGVATAGGAAEHEAQSTLRRADAALYAAKAAGRNTVRLDAAALEVVVASARPAPVT